MELDVIPPETEAAIRATEDGTTVTPPVDAPPAVYRKNCCGVPRDQRCPHDLRAAAFESGCGQPIMCRPASQWTTT